LSTSFYANSRQKGAYIILPNIMFDLVITEKLGVGL